ncbi:MAG: sodium:proton antiporter [Acidobacteriaceae bacterium]|nr:sodium:proton antiporter [Acidobacteriaceae bacterium]
MLPLIAIVVSLAAVFGLISSRWLKIPSTMGTMLLALLLSAVLAIASHVMPGIHAWAIHSVLSINYENFILHGMLSLLLFAGAFLLDLEQLAGEKFAITMLAGLGTALSAAITSAAIYFAAPLVGFHPPVLEAALFGALISPTDPIAVLGMLRRAAAPRYLQAQLAGESLFNDGIGAVLFLTILGVAESGRLPSLVHVGWRFVLDCGGALLLGVVFAIPVSRMMRMVNAYNIEILLTLSLALGGYAVADALHLSAPLEAVAAGLTLRWLNNRHSEDISHVEIRRFWAAIDKIQNSVLFVLMGFEVLIVSFSRTAFAVGGMAVVLVNASRFIATVATLRIIRLVQPHHRSSWFVLSWGGLRGGLAIALALSVPVNLGRDWMVAATYTVVVFSILVQGGTLNLLLKKSGIARPGRGAVLSRATK